MATQREEGGPDQEIADRLQQDAQETAASFAHPGAQLAIGEGVNDPPLHPPAAKPLNAVALAG